MLEISLLRFLVLEANFLYIEIGVGRNKNREAVGWNFCLAYRSGDKGQAFRTHQKFKIFGWLGGAVPDRRSILLRPNMC